MFPQDNIIEMFRLTNINIYAEQVTTIILPFPLKKLKWIDFLNLEAYVYLGTPSLLYNTKPRGKNV